MLTINLLFQTNCTWCVNDRNRNVTCGAVDFSTLTKITSQILIEESEENDCEQLNECSDNTNAHDSSDNTTMVSITPMY